MRKMQEGSMGSGGEEGSGPPDIDVESGEEQIQKVVRFPQTGIVQALNSTLERAEDHEFSGIYAIAISRDGNQVDHIWSQGIRTYPITLLGALRIAEERVLSLMDEEGWVKQEDKDWE